MRMKRSVDGRLDGSVDEGAVRAAWRARAFAAVAVAALAGGLAATAAADDGAASKEGAVAELGDGFFIGTGLGVSILSDVKIRDVTPPPGEIAFGNAGVAADVDAGFAWNIELGFRLDESFSLAIESGFYRNGFGGFSSGEFTTDIGLSTALVGGDGDFTQIPVFFNALYEIPLVKPETPSAAGGLNLRIGGGLGLVHVAADLDAIGAADVPGIFAAVDGSSWEFGGQLKIGLAYQISHAVELGIEYRIMAVGGANFGPATFSDPALVGFADVETERVLTQAVQARLSFEF